MEGSAVKESDVSQSENNNTLTEIKEMMQKNLAHQQRFNQETANTILGLKSQFEQQNKEIDDDEDDEKVRFNKYLQDLHLDIKKNREENIINVLSSEISDFKDVYSDNNVNEVTKKDPGFRKALDALWDAGDREKAARLMYERIKSDKSKSQEEEIQRQEQERNFEIAGGYGYVSKSEGVPRSPVNTFRHIRPSPYDLFPADSDFINPTPERKRDAYNKLLNLARGYA